jgi:hypothetical protein
MLLFLIGCVGVRTALAIFAKTINIKYLPYIGYLALIPAIGFIYIYLTGSRKTGAEVFGDMIWWNDIRPIHAVLYILFALYAINKKSYAWIILLIDVIFGLLAFLNFHLC